MAPLSREQTWQVLEAVRKVEDHRADAFIDAVAEQLPDADPSDEEVKSAIAIAQRAIAKQGAN